MGEYSLDDNIIFFKGEEDDLISYDKMFRFVDDNGLVFFLFGIVYDRIIVFIEQDFGILEDDEDDGQCGEFLFFLVEGEEGFLIDQEVMFQGYV